MVPASISVAEIYCQTRGEPNGKVGSGYFYTSRLVLKARHIIDGSFQTKVPPRSHAAQAEEILQTLAKNRIMYRIRTETP